jgi:hypothetical protein
MHIGFIIIELEYPSQSDVHVVPDSCPIHIDESRLVLDNSSGPGPGQGPGQGLRIVCHFA